MARPAYSTLLGQLLEAPAGYTIIGSPPAGYKWVLRDAQVSNTKPFGSQLYGCQVQNGALGQLLACLPPDAIGGVPFQWQGREVVEAGDTASFFAVEAGWSITLSGYVLSVS